MGLFSSSAKAAMEADKTARQDAEVLSLFKRFADLPCCVRLSGIDADEGVVNALNGMILVRSSGLGVFKSRRPVLELRTLPRTIIGGASSSMTTPLSIPEATKLLEVWSSMA